jgi:hypothetical protein
VFGAVGTVRIALDCALQRVVRVFRVLPEPKSGPIIFFTANGGGVGAFLPLRLVVGRPRKARDLVTVGNKAGKTS